MKPKVLLRQSFFTYHALTSPNTMSSYYILVQIYETQSPLSCAKAFFTYHALTSPNTMSSCAKAFFYLPCTHLAKHNVLLRQSFYLLKFALSSYIGSRKNNNKSIAKKFRYMKPKVLLRQSFFSYHALTSPNTMSSCA